MSNMKPEKPMALNIDGITYRYVGVMQYPMNREDQKRAGLIASNSRSLSGRTVKTQGEAA